MGVRLRFRGQTGSAEVLLVRKKARMSRSRVKTMTIVFRQPWHCAQRICTSRTDS